MFGYVGAGKRCWLVKDDGLLGRLKPPASVAYVGSLSVRQDLRLEGNRSARRRTGGKNGPTQSG